MLLVSIFQISRLATLAQDDKEAMLARNDRSDVSTTLDITRERCYQSFCHFPYCKEVWPVSSVFAKRFRSCV